MQEAKEPLPPVSPTVQRSRRPNRERVAKADARRQYHHSTPPLNAEAWECAQEQPGARASSQPSLLSPQANSLILNPASSETLSSTCAGSRKLVPGSFCRAS